MTSLKLRWVGVHNYACKPVSDVLIDVTPSACNAFTKITLVCHLLHYVHWLIWKEILYVLTTSISNSPVLCCYTTLWNSKIQKCYRTFS